MDKLILLVADIIKDNGSQTISIKDEITEEELNLLNSAFEFCGIYNCITQIKDIVIENGEAFKRFMSTENMSKLKLNGVSPERFLMLANTAILNYATSIKTYIDMETRLIKEKSSEDNLDQFNTMCHTFYDNHMEYRFWMNFRNYIVHCEFPYMVFNESVENGIKIICTKEHLLKFKNWKHAKDDILKMDDQVDLHLLVDNMSTLIYVLYISFVGFFAETIINGIKVYGEFCRKYNVKHPIIVKTKDRANYAGANMQPLPINELRKLFDILNDSKGKMFRVFPSSVKNGIMES